MRILAVITTLLLLTGLLANCGETERLQGHALYDQHCANCHMEEGGGLRQLIPPLAGADYLRDNPRQSVRGIRYGMQGALVVNGITYDQPMPGNKELTAIQIANIMNYVNNAWGNDYGTVTVGEVRDWLAETE